jgi:hypothetical protein
MGKRYILDDDNLVYDAADADSHDPLDARQATARLNEQADKIDRLRRFIFERVCDGNIEKHGGYHGRRVHMEGEKLLREPGWFPGEIRKAKGGA